MDCKGVQLLLVGAIEAPVIEMCTGELFQKESKCYSVRSLCIDVFTSNLIILLDKSLKTDLHCINWNKFSCTLYDNHIHLLNWLANIPVPGHGFNPIKASPDILAQVAQLLDENHLVIEEWEECM
jgi:hypothetical protein